MTEPRDEVIERVAREINDQLDDDWTTADTVAFREYFGQRAAARLHAVGLLADPEAQAELARRAASWWEAAKHYAKARRFYRHRAQVLRKDLSRVSALLAGACAENELLKNSRLARVNELLLEDRTAERDLALWLYAEAEWWSNQYQRDVVMVWKPRVETAEAERDQLRAEVERLADDLQGYQGDGAYEKGWEHGANAAQQKIEKLRAERDQLQARIDAALAKLDSYDGYGAGMMFHDELRAALQPGQHDKPEAAKQEPWCEEHGHPTGRCSYCATEDGRIDESQHDEPAVTVPKADSKPEAPR
jgi:hypothetical protein